MLLLEKSWGISGGFSLIPLVLTCKKARYPLFRERIPRAIIILYSNTYGILAPMG